MGDVVEISPSGRAKCRGCKESIPKGVVRFGESYDSAFTGGEALRYWHLLCAAKKLPVQVERALSEFDGDVPDKEQVVAELTAAKKKKGKGAVKAPLPHADLAPTGRARCLACSEPIPKGSVRVAVEREVDGPMGPMKSAGYLHPACALGFAEEQGEDTDDFVERLFQNSIHLEDADREKLQTELGLD
ncbi:MAG: hypothetical protein R3F59_02220 [Myxococcota bacterium]